MTYREYTEFQKEDYILRDVLAMDRTALANERTFLAYVKTTIAIVAGALTFFKFYDGFIAQIVCAALIILGVLLLLIGYARYTKVDHHISVLKGIDSEPDHAEELFSVVGYLLSKLQFAKVRV